MNRYQDAASKVVAIFLAEKTNLDKVGGSPDRFFHLGLSTATALQLVDALAFAGSTSDALSVVEEIEDVLKARQASREVEPAITACIMVKGELGKL